MDIYEYQNKRFFKEHNLPVLRGGIAYTPAEVERIVDQLSGNVYRLKVQIADDSREQGGFIHYPPEKQSGVRLAYSKEEAVQIAKEMFGNAFLTPTMRKEQIIQRVYIEEICAIQQKFGVSIRLDFVKHNFVLTVENNQTLTEFDMPPQKPSLFFWYKVIRVFNVSSTAQAKLLFILKQMYQVFLEYHAVAIEFRTLVLTPDSKWVIENGRIVFDNEAISRFPEIMALKEVTEGHEREALAEKYNFRYTPFDGNIACLVNGSGLGGATIELLESHDGHPACLLDVGTEPTGDSVVRALKLALSEPNVDGVFINIFGGLTRCDTIAQGLIDASREISTGIPMVVRMDGTNATIGERLLFESRLPFVVIRQPEEAVISIIKLVEGII